MPNFIHKPYPSYYQTLETLFQKILLRQKFSSFDLLEVFSFDKP
jgi:hypothetical protein